MGLGLKATNTFAKHLEKVFQPHPSVSNNDDIYDFLNTQYYLKLPLEKSLK
jgi:hypothetical protein